MEREARGIVSCLRPAIWDTFGQGLIELAPVLRKLWLLPCVGVVGKARGKPGVALDAGGEKRGVLGGSDRWYEDVGRLASEDWRRW